MRAEKAELRGPAARFPRYRKRSQHPDGLIIAKRVAKQGCCVFCEEPLPPRIRKRRLICLERGCRAAYTAAYQRDRRFARRAA